MKLYVPIRVKGMMVGDTENELYTNFADDFRRFDFDGLGEYVRGNLATTRDFQKGIHLHWSLPDSLCTGIQDEEANVVKYPSVPDRWMVTRIWQKDNDFQKEIKTKSWMVESNYKSITRNAWNSDSSVWPNNTKKGYTYAGRAYPFEQKDNVLTDGEYWSDFTIATSGNPLYAAFYHSCRNVFAFYDDLYDEPTDSYLENCKITYCVYGWYANSQSDILNPCRNQEQLLLLLDKLNWYVPSEQLEELSNEEIQLKTICHGMICDLHWINDKQRYSELDDVLNPDVTIANTSPEALATLLAHHNASFKNDKPFIYENLSQERLLLHLLRGSYKELADLDGIIRSENAIFQTFFKSTPGQKKYSLKNIQDLDETELLELQKKVNEINDLEEQLATYQAEMNYYKECLFDTMYKELKKPGYIDESIDYLNKIRKLAKETNELENIINNKKEIEADLATQNGDSFFEPANPILLFSKIQRDYSHGEDNSFNDSGKLLVRLKTLTKISFNNIFINAENLIDNLVENNEIIKESFLLSYQFEIGTQFIEELTTEGNDYEITKDMEDLTKIRCAPYAVEALLHEKPEDVWEDLLYDAVVPSKIAVSYYSSAWYPFYFDWKVTYFPDKNLLSEKPNLKAWELTEGFDYTYKEEINSFSKTGASLTGRSFLTAYVIKYLSETIDEVGINIPDAAWTDVLSQVLGGFNSQLLMRNTKIIPTIDKLVDKFIEKMAVKRIAEVNSLEIKSFYNDATQNLPIFDSFFAPLRGGFMSIDKISIIGSFGQIKQYQPYDCYTAESLRFPINQKANRILLPPRIIQPARIDFKWDENPILAWIVPNILEFSAAIFDENGIHICSLYFVKGTTVIRKSPQNGGKICHNLSELTSNQELLAFLENLRQKKRFLELVAHIDNALEKVNLSAEQDSFAFFIGRPVALVKGKVALELREPQKEYLSINKIAQKTNIENLEIPVFIGQHANNHDGVVGVYVKNNYDKILLNFAIDSKDDYFAVNGAFVISPHFKKLDWREVTILLDPCGEANIRTGILPVKSVKLPEKIVKVYLDKLYHVFFVAPLLCNGKNISLPLPVLEKMQWKWLENEGDLTLEQPTKKISTTTQMTSDSNIIREGWLTLSANLKGEDKENGI